MIEGYGGLDRPVAAYAGSPPRPGDVLGRFFVAHGLAAGLPLFSIGLSLLNTNPSCITFCAANNQPFPGDRAYLDRLLARSAEDIHLSDVTFRTLEISTISMAFLSTLIPTARRGLISRFEVIEDAMIVGEGMLIGLSTPLWLQRRIGRARPVSFHPEIAQGLHGGDAVGAPLMALNTTVVWSAFSSATTLLILEEAGPFWTFSSALALGALAGACTYWEVHAGAVFPSDIPLAIIDGLLSGAGAVLWNQIFWRGWPGDTARGDLPLRLRGLGIGLTPTGAGLMARGVF
jgi:hypothetical protein